jgi:hypothetical protein
MEERQRIREPMKFPPLNQKFTHLLTRPQSYLDKAKEKFYQIAENKNLLDKVIKLRSLTPELVLWLKEHYPEKRKIVQIGFQPAFVEKLSKNFSFNVLATGSVFANGTIDKIAGVKPIEEIIFYGVSISAIAELLKLKRVCFYSK